MTKFATINRTITKAPASAVAYKYADPTEDARWIDDETEAHSIASIDPSLIVPVVDMVHIGEWGYADGRMGSWYAPTDAAEDVRAAYDAIEDGDQNSAVCDDLVAAGGVFVAE